MTKNHSFFKDKNFYSDVTQNSNLISKSTDMLPEASEVRSGHVNEAHHSPKESVGIKQVSTVTDSCLFEAPVPQKRSKNSL